MMRLPLVLLLLSGTQAFAPARFSVHDRRRTTLSAISHRDALMTGAAAAVLFGVAASPQPAVAVIQPRTAKVEEATHQGVPERRIGINGVFVAMGYGSLAGSLLLGDEPEDFCSTIRTPTMNSFEESSMVVEARAPTSLSTTSALADRFVMDGIENFEETETSEEGEERSSA